jgi:methylglutaconyl-CoA hydratase
VNEEGIVNDRPLRVERDDRGVVTVTLDRPDVRNAFNAELIRRLRDTFESLAGDDGARVVVLTGSGRVFSAGADLHWMRGMVDNSYEENLADSRYFEGMLRAIHDCPHPVVARVNGHALGGGTGLIACADTAVAARGALLGFTEVRLGIAPAVISPYVLAKIGAGSARHLFLTGERFDAEEARRLGLVNLVVGPDELDAQVGRVVEALLAAGPRAQGEIKRLLRRVAAAGDLDEAAGVTVDTIARLRVSEEGQEGMAAFFDKRPPAWLAASG